MACNCPAVAEVESLKRSECDDLRQDLYASIQSIEPELVVLTNSASYVEPELGEVGTCYEGHRVLAEFLSEINVELLIMHDIARWKSDPPTCVVENPANACALDRQVVEQDRAAVANAEVQGWNYGKRQGNSQPRLGICRFQEPVVVSGASVKHDKQNSDRSEAIYFGAGATLEGAHGVANPQSRREQQS